MAVRIGELLLKEKRITPEQLQEALSYQKASGGKLGLNLVKLGFVRDEEITSLLSRQYGVPSINLGDFEIDQSVVKLIPADTAQKYQILPLSRAGATLTIAMTDPTNVFAMDDIKFMTGYNVEPVVASESALMEAIARYYNLSAKALSGNNGNGNGNGQPSALDFATQALQDLPLVDASEVEVLDELEEISVEALARQGEEAPVVRLVNVMLMSAISKGASDIHIEPYEKELRVRYRVDGVLYNIMAPPMKFRDPIVSRVKIMAKLDIAEKRLPQDGRIKIRFNDAGHAKEIDFRVSSLPTLFGEKIVLRLLDREKLMLDMTKLGFEPESLLEVRGRDQPAVGHGARDRADRQRQDEHALLVDLEAEHARDEHHDGGGPGRVQPRRHQPGPDPRRHRPQFRRRAALVPPPGPEHHPRRRDPRLRDGGDRGQGRADGPPRALDPSHQRRAEHHQPPDEHGHRAVPRGELGQPDLRAAPRAPRVQGVRGAGRGGGSGAHRSSGTARRTPRRSNR